MSEVRIARLEEQVKAVVSEHADTKSLIVTHIDNCERVREGFRRDITGVKISQAKTGIIVSAVVVLANIVAGVVLAKLVSATINSAADRIEAQAN